MTTFGLIIALILSAIVGGLVEALLKSIVPEEPKGRHIFTILVAIAVFGFASVQIPNYLDELEPLLIDDSGQGVEQSRSVTESIAPSPTSSDRNETILVSYSSPTPDHTSTPYQTATPRPTFTPRPTAAPHNHSSPKDLIPSNLPIPESLAVEEKRTTSNEDVASRYDNPTEVFQLLERWERETGYHLYYLTKEDCESITDYWDIIISISSHNSAEGTKPYWEWRNEYERADDFFKRQESIEDLGEVASVTWYSGGDDNCEPPKGWQSVKVHFIRYNVIVAVQATSVIGMVSEDEMLGLVSRISQLIDLKIIATADQ